METFKFKTNVNCSGCIAKITPQLNQLSSIVKWEVDTVDPLKILTVETTETNPNKIIETLKSIGYNAELL